MQSVETHHVRRKYPHLQCWHVPTRKCDWQNSSLEYYSSAEKKYANCILIILLEHRSWYFRDLAGGTCSTLCAHVFTRARGCVGVICCSVTKTCLACWRCRRGGIEQSFLQRCERTMIERESPAFLILFNHKSSQLTYPRCCILPPPVPKQQLFSDWVRLVLSTYSRLLSAS